MSRERGTIALLIGDVPRMLGDLLETAGLVVRKAPSFSETGTNGEVAILVTAAHIPVGELELARFPGLLVLARSAAGIDNVDLEAAARRGLDVVHAPEANAQSAAELTIGLLFALTRQVAHHDRAMHAGRWSRGDFVGTELAGLRLGIVGLGRVGGRVSRMANAIPMQVRAYDPFIEAERFRHLQARQADTLERLLEVSDVLTLHCPLTPVTRGMIGPSQLERLPPGAFVLNVARGGIVDEGALASLIHTGRLGGAALDCWQTEPPEVGNPLLALPPDRLVATPHVGARTARARENVARETAANILAALVRLGVK